jgi:hypothetical protein
MRILPRTCLVGLAALAGAAPAAAGTIRHLPPAEAAPARPLEVTAEVGAGWDATLTLHYRPMTGAGAWSTAAFTRSEPTEWRAEVPAEAVVWPGVEYYIDSVGPGEAAAVVPEFASADDPHGVRIVRGRHDLRRERELARVDHRRSRVHVAGEMIDYGSRQLGAPYGRVRDAYYRIDADFAYRLLAYPLEQIRLGYTRMIGDVPNTLRDDPDGCPAVDPPDCSLRAGFKVGGWFELRFGVGDGVDIDARAMVMATNVGFGVGGRGELRFGNEDANHVAVGAEALQDIGATGFFRLGWATVPQLPMAATVEVTDLPSEVRAAGIRFVYDVGLPLGPGLRIGGRIGYQARDADVGGLSGGGNLTVDF